MSFHVAVGVKVPYAYSEQVLIASKRALMSSSLN